MYKKIKEIKSRLKCNTIITPGTANSMLWQRYCINYNYLAYSCYVDAKKEYDEYFKNKSKLHKFIIEKVFRI